MVKISFIRITQQSLKTYNTYLDKTCRTYVVNNLCTQSTYRVPLKGLVLLR